MQTKSITREIKGKESAEIARYLLLSFVNGRRHCNFYLSLWCRISWL